MANCEGEIIPCDKNVINTFAHQHLKYDENEKYYIISLENFLFRSKILRTKSNETCFLEQTFYFFYRISVILSFKKKKKRWNVYSSHNIFLEYVMLCKYLDLVVKNCFCYVYE